MSGIVGQNLGRGSGLIKAGAIDDNSVTLAKMAGGTDGNIISYDASGDPTAIATGDDGQVLTSAGAGQPPAFEAAAAGGDLSFGGDTFGADKTIGSNDTYALSFETDGNEAMKIDTAGIITKPLQPAFSAQASAGQTGLGQTTWIVGAFNTEIYDVSADYDTTTYTFTAPVTGKYLFTMFFTVLGFSGRPYSMFNTSNRTYTQSYWGPQGTNAGDSIGGSTIADMDANDTCFWQVYAYDDSSWDLGCYYFTGALLC
jgi:hypothetical protein